MRWTASFFAIVLLWSSANVRAQDVPALEQRYAEILITLGSYEKEFERMEAEGASLGAYEVLAEKTWRLREELERLGGRAEALVADVAETRAEQGQVEDTDMLEGSSPSFDGIEGRSDREGEPDRSTEEEGAPEGTEKYSQSLSRFDVLVRHGDYDGEEVERAVSNGEVLAFSADVPTIGSDAAPLVGSLVWQLYDESGGEVPGVRKTQEISETGIVEPARFRIRLNNLKIGRYAVRLTHRLDSVPEQAVVGSKAFVVDEPITIQRVVVAPDSNATSHTPILMTDQAPHGFIYFKLGATIPEVKVTMKMVDEETGSVLAEQTVTRERNGDGAEQRVGIRLATGVAKSERPIRFVATIEAPGVDRKGASVEFFIQSYILAINAPSSIKSGSARAFSIVSPPSFKPPFTVSQRAGEGLTVSLGSEDLTGTMIGSTDVEVRRSSLRITVVDSEGRTASGSVLIDIEPDPITTENVGGEPSHAEESVPSFDGIEETAVSESEATEHNIRPGETCEEHRARLECRWVDKFRMSCKEPLGKWEVSYTHLCPSWEGKKKEYEEHFKKRAIETARLGYKRAVNELDDLVDECWSKVHGLDIKAPTPPTPSDEQLHGAMDGSGWLGFRLDYTTIFDPLRNPHTHYDLANCVKGTKPVEEVYGCEQVSREFYNWVYKKVGTDWITQVRDWVFGDSFNISRTLCSEYQLEDWFSVSLTLLGAESTPDEALWVARLKEDVTEESVPSFDGIEGAAVSGAKNSQNARRIETHDVSELSAPTALDPETTKLVSHRLAEIHSVAKVSVLEKMFIPCFREELARTNSLSNVEGVPSQKFSEEQKILIMNAGQNGELSPAARSCLANGARSPACLTVLQFYNEILFTAEIKTIHDAAMEGNFPAMPYSLCWEQQLDNFAIQSAKYFNEDPSALREIFKRYIVYPKK